MEKISLKIKRPALSEVLSGKFDNNYEFNKVITETAQYLIDDPCSKITVEEILNKDELYMDDSYELETIQYELLKRLSSKGDLTSHNVFVIVGFTEKILKKALAIVNTEYKA